MRKPTKRNSPTKRGLTKARTNATHRATSSLPKDPKSKPAPRRSSVSGRSQANIAKKGGAGKSLKAHTDRTSRAKGARDTSAAQRMRKLDTTYGAQPRKRSTTETRRSKVKNAIFSRFK